PYRWLGMARGVPESEMQPASPEEVRPPARDWSRPARSPGADTKARRWRRIATHTRAFSVPLRVAPQRFRPGPWVPFVARPGYRAREPQKSAHRWLAMRHSREPDRDGPVPFAACAPARRVERRRSESAADSGRSPEPASFARGRRNAVSMD